MTITVKNTSTESLEYEQGPQPVGTIAPGESKTFELDSPDWPLICRVPEPAPPKKTSY